MTTLTGNELVQVLGSVAGIPAAVQFPVTTAQIAALGGGTGGSPVISKQFDLSTGANTTYALDSYADFSYTINSINGIRTASGTITAAIQINGVNVTGLGAINATTVPASIAATASNTVNVGDRVTVVLTNNSTAVNLEFNLSATRTS